MVEIAVCIVRAVGNLIINVLSMRSLVKNQEIWNSKGLLEK